MGLSRSGIAAVEAAIDPFHDYTITDHQGWPDSLRSGSVVQVLNRSVQIPNPGAGNFDASIIVTQFDTYAPLMRITDDTASCTLRLSGSQPGGICATRDDNSPFFNYGGITVMTAAEGTNLLPHVTGVTTKVYIPSQSTEATTSSGPVSSDAYRIIGCGFEVVNTTADIYKQGIVTTWRMEDCDEDVFMINKVVQNTGDPGSGYLTGVEAGLDHVGTNSTRAELMRLPPYNTSVAKLIPGSLQWAAREGAYLVAPVGTDNQPRRATDKHFVMTNEWTSTGNINVDSTQPTFVNAHNVSNTDETVSQGSMNTAWPVHLSNVTPTGAFFSGLSAVTTLTLNMRWYVEIFPSFQNTALLPMATPSAGFDPLALDLYSNALLSMPMGAPLADNAKGAWWKKLLVGMNKVGDQALSIGLSGVLGSKAQAASQSADQFLKLISPATAPLMRKAKGKPMKLTAKEKKQAMAQVNALVSNARGRSRTPRSRAS